MKYRPSAEAILLAALVAAMLFLFLAGGLYRLLRHHWE